uniref:DUF642 domain-containing protein n=1 Tax=Oryza punctata TaxID=4537 RepID=A0A0E0LID2_ORYPU
MEFMVRMLLLLLLPLSSAATAVAPLAPAPPPRAHTQTADGVLVNGNFAMSPRKMNATVIVGRDSLPGWALRGHVEYVSGGPQPGGMYFAAAPGVHALRLGARASAAQAVAVRPGAAYALTFAATRTCARDVEYEEALRLRVAVSPSFSAPGDVPVRTLYGAAAADAWAWGFRAAERDAQVVFSNPAADDHDDGLNCGPLLAAVAIKELPAPMPSKGKPNTMHPWMASLRFVASGRRARVTFYSSYYHTSAGDGVSPCGPVLDQVKVQPLMTKA